MRKLGRVILAGVGLALAAMIAIRCSDGSQPPSATGPAQSPASPCGERLAIDLDFSFPNREAPWQRGRRYELELSVDRAKTVCSFEVPVGSRHSENAMGNEDCGFALTPSWEPAGLTLSGRPKRVEVRVLSGGQVFYRGSVSPQYERVGEDCSLDVDIDLFSVEQGEN